MVNELHQHLVKIIRDNGPISIAHYMSECLFNPKYGYYTTKKIFGADGDFITSPEISQVFGELIGIWCASFWEKTGCRQINLIEFGPGLGTLMDDLLRGTKHIKNFHENISICMVEASDTLINKQQEKLKDKHNNIKWYKNFSEIEHDKPFIFLANEFFDALPISQYIKLNGILRERLIDIDANGNLQFTHANFAAKPELPEKFINSLQDNEITEFSSFSSSIMKDISSSLKENGGAGIIIDYGYSDYMQGDSLQALKNHKYHNILENPGEADITSHVNFKMLKDIADSSGINSSDIITQSNFLNSMGIDIRKQALMKKASNSQKKTIEDSIRRLIDIKEMGELFKVLIVWN